MKIYCFSKWFRKCADNKSLRIICLFRMFGKDKDGFVLYYKRLDGGKYQWPRKASEVRPLSRQEFRWLMEGLEVDQPTAIKTEKNAGKNREF